MRTWCFRGWRLRAGRGGTFRRSPLFTIGVSWKPRKNPEPGEYDFRRHIGVEVYNPFEWSNR